MSSQSIQSDAQIIATVKQAVALHRDTKANLVKRMEALLHPVPSEATLEVLGHRIEYRTIYASCSQWADHSYPTIGTDKAYVIDDALTIGEPDCSHFDGHNQQYQFGATYLDRAETHRVRPASAKLLREIARELPAVLLAYAARKSEEAAANTAAAQA